MYRKTTTIVFKMLARELTALKLGEPKPRQVFITKSPVLANKVEEYFNDLLRSSFSAPTSAEQLQQLADTKKRNEEMLLGTEYRTLNSNLPNCLSKLEEGHFPLFLTFDIVSNLASAALNHI